MASKEMPRSRPVDKHSRPDKMASNDVSRSKSADKHSRPDKMVSNDLSRSKFVDGLIGQVIQLSNGCYISNFLHSQLSVYNKLEYLHGQYSSEICDDNYYEKARLIDSEIFKTILLVFNIPQHIPSLQSGDVYSAAIKLIKTHHISFMKNMKVLIENVPTNNNDTLTKLIIEKIEEGKAKVLKSMENNMATELKNTQYFLTISTIMDYILSGTSQSLINYMFIFMLHNEPTDRTVNQSSLCDVATAEKSRMNRHAEYFNKTRSILKKIRSSILSAYKWHKKLESALTWYFVFSIIKPTLPSSHPIHHYSYNLAQAFAGFFDSKTVKTDLLPDFSEKSIEMKELLDKINNHETNRLLYIITRFTNQTRQIENVGDISFTFEFSASAAVLIAQNRLTELFDLYKTSTGTFGSGMTSSISTLMENSFRDAMGLIKPSDKFTEPFLHLARANLRSKIDDWNGVDDDLKHLITSNVEKSYCYNELKTRYEQASYNRTSILNKQQRIEYLLIRSFLCTSLGEFQDALTALLDANYMVNIMKSVPSEHDLATEKKEAPKDDKILSELQSFTETVNEYLQKHLHFSIEQSRQQLTSLSYLQCLGEHFQNLNILIGTFSIKYDEKLHDFAFDHYFKALPSPENYKYFNQLNETEFSNMLTNLKKFLETLKECTKQAPFTLDENVFSDFIQNMITFDKFYQINEEPNPLVKQYYQILDLNTHIRSLSNIPEQRTTVRQKPPNESQTNTPKVPSSEHRSGSSDESDEHHSVGQDSPPTTPLDTTTFKYYNILSLDGGGIRGIVEAIILMEIERRTGRSIGQLFNCFAGTSTGGILACGLAKDSPKSAKELLSLYLGPRRFEIFKKRWLHPLPWLFMARYSSSGLEKILEKELPSDCLSTCGNNDLIIPTEILGQGSALFINTTKSFENSNGESFEQRGLWFYDESERNHFMHRHTCDISLKDVALCTSAASPLFKPKKHKIKNKSYTFYDGGFKHNQPDSIALQWATEVRRIPEEDILLLSIGNSTAAPKPLKRNDNLCYLAYNLKSTVEAIGEKSPNEVCTAILGKQRYIRIIPDINVSPAMDDIDPANLQLLWEAAWKTITQMDKARKFNKLCKQLLERSNPPASSVKDGRLPMQSSSHRSNNDLFQSIRNFDTLHENVSPVLHDFVQGTRKHSNDRPSEEISYYPSRYMRDPDLYDRIDNLCPSSRNGNMMGEDLPAMLNTLFRRLIRGSNDRLQYPGCCRYDSVGHPHPLSIAAGIGYIPLILHYFKDMQSSMNRPFNLAEETKRDIRGSNTKSQCQWNSLHYAVANGEILAALDILYNEPLELSNLTSAMEENVLREMIKRLNTKTNGPPKKYTSSELAKKTGHSLMATQLYIEYNRIDRQLKHVKK